MGPGLTPDEEPQKLPAPPPSLTQIQDDRIRGFPPQVKWKTFTLDSSKDGNEKP